MAPKRLDTVAAAQYLRDTHGIPLTEKTLRNRRAAGKGGPACQYFGVKPLYDVSELDRWARNDALQPENPVRRNMRRRAAERAAETKSGRTRRTTEGETALNALQP